MDVSHVNEMIDFDGNQTIRFESTIVRDSDLVYRGQAVMVLLRLCI